MTDSAAGSPAAPAPQFRKTKQGKWAVMGPVDALQAALAGDGKVKVLKKSGDWSDFTVVSLGRPFDVDGVAMVYGYDDEGDPNAGAPADRASTASASAANPRSGSSRSSSSSSGSSSSAGEQPPSTPPPPPRDESEPLPDYRGGPEDEWQDGF